MSFWGGFTTRTGFLLNNFSWEVKLRLLRSPLLLVVNSSKTKWRDGPTSTGWCAATFLCVELVSGWCLWVSGFWLHRLSEVIEDHDEGLRWFLLLAAVLPFKFINYKYDSSIYAHIYTRVIALSLSLCLYIYIYVHIAMQQHMQTIVNKRLSVWEGRRFTVFLRSRST